MKKLLIVFLFCFVFLVSCNNEFDPPKDDIKLYQIVEDFLYSDDIYLKVPCNNENGYFESKYSIALEGYIGKLHNFSEVSLINGVKDIEGYINNIINEDTIILISKIENSQLRVYINKTGKTIIVRDSSLYELNDNCLYSDFTVNDTNINQIIEADSIRMSYKENINNYYSHKIIDGVEWTNNNLDNISYDLIEDVHVKDSYLDIYEEYIYYLYLQDILSKGVVVLEIPYLTFGLNSIPIINADDNMEVIRFGKSSDVNYYIINDSILLYNFSNEKLYMISNNYLNMEICKNIFNYNIDELNNKVTLKKIENNIN